MIPELSTEEEEEDEERDVEDGSSDEFTDSIEEDDKVAVKTSAFTQVRIFPLSFRLRRVCVIV